MSYKYCIIHIPTGNTIGVCYDSFSRTSKNYRLQRWLSLKDKELDTETGFVLNEEDTGILGFFLSDNQSCYPIPSDGVPFFDISKFSYTNKTTLTALINSFNFRFDVGMDFYGFDFRQEMFKLMKSKGKKIIPIPNEFEIMRIK